jgi:hypothetical protein
MTEQTKSQEERSWSEEFEIETERLLDTLKTLVHQANVRRIVIRKDNDDVLLDLPLPAGLLAGGILAIYMPWIAIGTALVGLATRLRVQVIRRGDETSG